jgi:hypothetical protein
MNLRFANYDLRASGAAQVRGSQAVLTGNALSVPERIGRTIRSGWRSELIVTLRNLMVAQIIASRVNRNS